MIPNPIRRVLSTLRSRNVRFLLMGGQACVFYGAAEFSRDADIVILLEPDNVTRLHEALAELKAECIAVPPFDPDYLRRGHAVHFRCHTPDTEGIRLDVMAVMRGVDRFPLLWDRRTTVTTRDGWDVDLLSLPDLVRAKKTQRDKDWPMVRRLLEADYAANRKQATPERVRFWILESRTPRILMELSTKFPDVAKEMQGTRPLLKSLGGGDADTIEKALFEEEIQERGRDRTFWTPLVRELEDLRHRKSSVNRREKGDEP